MVHSIRAARAEDRNLLVAFHHALYVDHHKAMVPEDERVLGAYRDLANVLRSDVDAILAKTDHIALVSWDGDTPSGYITGRVVREERRVLAHRGIVGDWYVEPDFRGLGVGKLLLDTLLQAFRTRGCEVAESTTWPGNQPARKGHLAAGFSEVETKYRLRLVSTP